MLVLKVQTLVEKRIEKGDAGDLLEFGRWQNQYIGPRRSVFLCVDCRLLFNRPKVD